METKTTPKPIEILPFFHATNTQAVCITENETQIHANDSQTQRCTINISECNPIIVSEIDQIESLGTQESNKPATMVHLSSSLITSLATINDQIIACDNIDSFEVKSMPDTVIAELGAVPHLSKTVYEQIVSQKTDSLPDIAVQHLHQAHEIFSSQHPIEIQEANIGESEECIIDKYKPTRQTATCIIVANESLNTQETVVQSSSMKFYPETFIATEEATPKYVEQFSYQTQEICASETEKTLDSQARPSDKKAHVEFSKLQAITMELTEVIESETISSHSVAADTKATAKDSFDLHREMETSLIQLIDSVEPSESLELSTKKALLSVEEMGSNIVETVNVFHSEKPLDIDKTIAQSKAAPNIVEHKSYNVSEVLVQERDVEFCDVPHPLAKVSEIHELYQNIEQCDEQTFDVTDVYRHKEMEQSFKAQVEFELQKSTTTKTIIAHEMTEQSYDMKKQEIQPKYKISEDINKPLTVSETQIIDSEQIFDTKQQQNQPKYDLVESLKKSIVVSETQIIDTEKLLEIHPTDVRHLNITDSANQFAHVGSVFETIPYESMEPLPTNLEKCVSATEKPDVFHELVVNVSNASESVVHLETEVFSEQKTATTNVITKNALEIAMEETAETLDKLNINIPEEHRSNVKHDLTIINPINVIQTELLEYPTSFDANTFKTASASTSTIEYKAKHIEENWPIDTSMDFNVTTDAGQKLRQNLIETTAAVQTSTVIPADTIAEFEHSLEKPKKPKLTMNELSGIVIEDIVSQETATENAFELAQQIGMGQIVDDIELQHRCEKMEQTTFESSTSLESMTNIPATSTTSMTDALSTAKVEEVLTNVCEITFETAEAFQHHGKIYQETFNVIGQSLQNVPLEKEDVLNIKTAKTIEGRESIEKRECYDTSEVEIFEKETELRPDEVKKDNTIKISASQMLNSASVFENVSLANVQPELFERKDRPVIAVSKVDELFEGISSQDITILEVPKDLTASETKLSTAKSSIESMKTVQVETVKIFEREEEFQSIKHKKHKSKERLEDNLQIAISEITQPMEQNANEPEHIFDAQTARQIADEISEHAIFESVYLESQEDTQKYSQLTNESTVHAINVIEQFPLYKEQAFEDNQTKLIITRPKESIQEQNYLKSAQKQSEINEFVFIKTNKTADVITNKKRNQKTKSKETREVMEGKWSTRTIYIISGIYHKKSPTHTHTHTQTHTHTHTYMLETHHI